MAASTWLKGFISWCAPTVASSAFDILAASPTGRFCYAPDPGTSIGNRYSTSLQTQMIGDQVYVDLPDLQSYKWQYTTTATSTVYSPSFSLLWRFSAEYHNVPQVLWVAEGRTLPIYICTMRSTQSNSSVSTHCSNYSVATFVPK